MGLREYKRKRDFKKTPEPPDRKRPARDKGIFVIQKHAASHLHYDLRLELDGVLKSWAVPKGPSLDPEVKRLAMHVEDHPVGYGSFEGTIPQGEYGGGTVLLWDRGTWIPEEEPRKGYKSGRLKFTLSGEKLHGRWMLVRFGKPEKGKETWLLRKERDEHAKPSRKIDILEMRPESVKSGLLIEEIGVKKAKPKRAARKKSSGANKGSVKAKKKALNLDLASFKFELATLTDKAPEGDEWLYEIKLDGYRVQAIIAASEVTLVTRNGNDYTDKFPTIAGMFKELDQNGTVIDGEVAITDENGKTDFQRLQNHLSTGDESEVQFYAFDLLAEDGEDLRKLPLVERKERLEALCKKLKSPNLIYSKHLEGNGTEIHQKACALDLEGLICKRRNSPYIGRRTLDWLKVKCMKRQEFVVAGFTESTNASLGFGALILGYYNERDQLRYAGKVGTGFTVQSRLDLKRKLKQLITDRCPFEEKLASGERRGVTWVTPKLVAEIAFTEWTSDKRCRHPSFQGLREDKPIKNVSREIEMPLPKVQKMSRSASRPAKRGSIEIAGVTITHPDRPLTQGSKVTKRSIAEFYLANERIILPYFRNRPIVLVRCPAGGKVRCFYQKHVNEGIPDDIPRINLREGDQGMVDYVGIEKIEHLIELVQLNTIEFHGWGSLAKDVEHPDRMIFDLDPAPDVPWKEVVIAARNLRKYLQRVKLESFVKTTGGKGIHLVIPIAPKYEWDEVKELSKQLAIDFAEQYPGKFTTVMTKSKRVGKIFIDYLRNGRGATSVLPYSTRAKPGNPISLPLDWKELSRPGSEFLLPVVARRLKSGFKDPWAKIHTMKQSLTTALKHVK